MSANASDKFLSGNFAPIQEELSYPISHIQGHIPTDLVGSFYRMGPNPKFNPIDPNKYHWMDGDGMIHRIKFHHGKAYYANRWVHTKGLAIEEREGRSIWGGIHSLPDFNNPYGLATKNTSNTALVWHANRLFSLWEQGLPYEIDKETLETLVQEENFNGQWNSAFSAHCKVDARKKELITFNWGLDGVIQYGIFDNQFKLIHKASIKLPGKPIFMHDFAITEHFALFFDTPQTVDLSNMMSGKSPFEFDPSNGCRLGVMPRNGSEVTWYDIPVCHIPHTCNAFEEGNQIVLEACRSESNYALFEFNLPNDNHSTATHSVPMPLFTRWKIDTVSGNVEQTLFRNLPGDFPRIHDHFVGYKNRYSYLLCNTSDNYLFNSFTKLDREGDVISQFHFPEHCRGTEFVFATRKGAQSEDDGYCIGQYHNEQTDTSYVAILDAKSIADGPVATLQLAQRIPYGFHSAWV